MNGLPERSLARKSPWLLAIFIVAAGGFLRFAYYDSPFQHPDEPISTEVVQYMRQSGNWDVNWANARLPAVYRYDQYNFSSHLYANYFFYRLVKLFPATLRWRSERNGVLVYRFLSAALASFAIWQTLQLGRRAGNWTSGIGAAALTSVAPVLVQDAHYIRPEPLVTVLTLAAVSIAWPHPRAPVSRSVGAAVCVGLLVACKISMLLLVWVPFVPWFLEALRGRIRWKLFGAILAGLLAGFALGAPGAFIHPAAFVHGIKQLAGQYSSMHPPHSLLGGGPTFTMMVSYIVATFGWAVIVGWAVGFVFLIRSRRWSDTALLAVPVLLFVGYFATRSVFFERNLSHVVPLALIVTAIGATWFVERRAGAHRRFAAGLAAVLFMVLAVRPAHVSLRLIAIDYRGVGSALRAAFRASTQSEHPGAVWREELLLTNKPLDELAEYFRGSSTPVLLAVPDYRDEWTRRGIDSLVRLFRVTILPEHPGTFADLPTCTLLTYHNAIDRYFLVEGIQLNSVSAP